MSDQTPVLFFAIADDEQRESILHSISETAMLFDIVSCADIEEACAVGNSGKRIECAFIDAEIIEKDLPRFLTQCSTVVVFNLSRAKTIRSKIDRFKDFATSVSVEEVEGTLTSLRAVRTVQEMFPHLQFSDSQDLSLNRLASARPQDSVRTFPSSPQFTKGLSGFLQYLRAPISENNARLETEFIDVSNSDSIPSEQRAGDDRTCLIEVSKARSAVTEFVTDAGNVGKGCYLLGRSGVGKTTLVHRVCQDLAKSNKAFAVCIDYTLITATDRDNHETKCVVDLVSTLRNHPAIPETISSRKRNTSFVEQVLMYIRKNGQFELLSELEFTQVEPLLEYRDVGTMVAMFCKSQLEGMSVEIAARTYGSQSQLIEEARDWYETLLNDLPRAFCLYASHILDDRLESFDRFSYRRILHFLVGTGMSWVASEVRIAIWHALEDATREAIGLDNRAVASIQSRDSAAAVTDFLNLGAPDLRRIALRTLQKLSSEKNIPLVVVLDNIDQRPRTEIEEIYMRRALNLFRSELAGAVPNSVAIASMRGTTYHNSPWLDAETPGWDHLEILPADLLCILDERCTQFRTTGDLTGEGPAYGIVRDISKLVASWKKLPLRDSKSYLESNLADIVRWRHPFNVRQQLRAFTKCCRNALLHQNADKLTQETSGRAPSWSESRSFAFYLRVFLLGDAEYFREDVHRIPNIFDAGVPSSPFNACLRSWLLDFVGEGGVMAKKAIVARFVSAGVPREMIETTLDDFLRYNIVLSYIHDPTQVHISIWGRHFRNSIAYDFPYIDTVWWTTSMPQKFSLGQPRRLFPSELREFAHKFLQWLRFEDRVAVAAIEGSPHVFTKLFTRVQLRVQESLRRIERALK